MFFFYVSTLLDMTLDYVNIDEKTHELLLPVCSKILNHCKQERNEQLIIAQRLSLLITITSAKPTVYNNSREIISSGTYLHCYIAWSIILAVALL